jgi:hypothetical protein
MTKAELASFEHDIDIIYLIFHSGFMGLNHQDNLRSSHHEGCAYKPSERAPKKLRAQPIQALVEQRLSEILEIITDYARTIREILKLLPEIEGIPQIPFSDAACARVRELIMDNGAIEIKEFRPNWKFCRGQRLSTYIIYSDAA